MGHPPCGMTLERVDVNSGYSIDNCRWATFKEQCNNKRTTVRVSAFGVTKSLQEFADEYGLKYSTLRHRIGRLGWEIERALLTPTLPSRRGIKNKQRN